MQKYNIDRISRWATDVRRLRKVNAILDKRVGDLTPKEISLIMLTVSFFVDEDETIPFTYVHEAAALLNDRNIRRSAAYLAAGGQEGATKERLQ